MSDTYTPEQGALIERWRAHMDAEFAAKDAAASVAGMAPDGTCNHAPVLTGGSGAAEMMAFYRDHFIPKLPADMRMELISRAVGQNRVIDEQLLRFTHDAEIDWMLPGVAPTGKRVEVVFVVIVQFDAEGRSTPSAACGAAPRLHLRNRLVTCCSCDRVLRAPRAWTEP